MSVIFPGPRSLFAPPVRWAPVLVTPAVTIVSSSIASPTVITTLTPHGLASGDTVTLVDHAGSTPAVTGALVATVLSPTTFSVPVAVTIAGAGGTVTRTTAVPAIALAEAKLHARMTAADTTEDAAVASWTKAAQQQVETDTGLKLLTQTYDLVGDAFPAGRRPIVLPFGPLQSVTSIKSYDSATPSVLQTLPASDYIADVSSVPGRIGLEAAATWPTDLREFQPVTVRVIVGYDALTKIPEALLQAVRLAIGWHSGNREPTLIETQSYDWLIDPYRPVVVA
jgi:uncharacterized phiE125 gp8 family phage protein